MKFSVIIPAFNEELYIKDSLRAVQKQTVSRDNYEIIVVNNNSTDLTKEIAEISGADKVIDEFEQGTNIARNKGIAESSGEILAFLDADSIPPPDWLEKISFFLSLPGVAAVSGPCDYGFENKFKNVASRVYTHRVFPRLDENLEKIFRLKAGAAMGGNFAARRETIKKIGGLPPLTFDGDDAAIAILISRRVGKVLFTPELEVKSSPRRFQKNGLVRTTARYAKNYFRMYFTLPR